MLSKEIDPGQNSWRETLRCMKTRVWWNVGGWRRSGWLPCMWTVGRAFLAEDHTRSGKKGGMVRVPDSPMGTTGTTATEVRKCPETGLSLDFRCGSRDVAKLEENCNLSNLKDGIVNNFSIKSTYCFFCRSKGGTCLQCRIVVQYTKLIVVYIGFKAFDPLHIVHAGAPAGSHSWDDWWWRWWLGTLWLKMTWNMAWLKMTVRNQYRAPRSAVIEHLH